MKKYQNYIVYFKKLNQVLIVKRDDSLGCLGLTEYQLSPDFLKLNPSKLLDKSINSIPGDVLFFQLERYVSVLETNITIKK